MIRENSIALFWPVDSRNQESDHDPPLSACGISMEVWRSASGLPS